MSDTDQTDVDGTVDGERTDGRVDGRLDEQGDERPLVLVVDDEERVTQAFELWLESDYRIRTATSGEEALDRIDESVDVVLLDRHMPGLSGDETLECIRERGFDPFVAMVTGVDPDFDIVEMPFEDYVTKPVGKDELTDVVERLLSFDDYHETVRDLFSVAQKQAALETQFSSPELDRRDEYEELTTEYERLSERAERAAEGIDHEAAQRAFENL